MLNIDDMRRNDNTLTETFKKAQQYFPIPVKYLYSLVMSSELFIKLWSTEAVDFMYYNIENVIHYQERNGIIRISFTTQKSCNEVQTKALEYIIKEATGSVPILRIDDIKKKLKIK